MPKAWFYRAISKTFFSVQNRFHLRLFSRWRLAGLCFSNFILSNKVFKLHVCTWIMLHWMLLPLRLLTCIIFSKLLKSFFLFFLILFKENRTFSGLFFIRKINTQNVLNIRRFILILSLIPWWIFWNSYPKAQAIASMFTPWRRISWVLTFLLIFAMIPFTSKRKPKKVAFSWLLIFYSFIFLNFSIMLLF